MIVGLKRALKLENGFPVPNGPDVGNRESVLFQMNLKELAVST